MEELFKSEIKGQKSEQNQAFKFEILKQQKQYQQFMEVVLEMVMQERQVMTPTAIGYLANLKNKQNMASSQIQYQPKINSEFSIQIPLINQLNEYLRQFPNQLNIQHTVDTQQINKKSINLNLNDEILNQLFRFNRKQYKANLNILAKNQNEQVLAEKWAFSIVQYSQAEILQNIRNSCYLNEGENSEQLNEYFNFLNYGSNLKEVNQGELFQFRENIKITKQKLMVALRSVKSMLLTMPMSDILWANQQQNDLNHSKINISQSQNSSSIRLKNTQTHTTFGSQFQKQNLNQLTNVKANYQFEFPNEDLLKSGNFYNSPNILNEFIIEDLTDQIKNIKLCCIKSLYGEFSIELEYLKTKLEIQKSLSLKTSKSFYMSNNNQFHDKKEQQNEFNSLVISNYITPNKQQVQKEIGRGRFYSEQINQFPSISNSNQKLIQNNKNQKSDQIETKSENRQQKVLPQSTQKSPSINYAGIEHCDFSQIDENLEDELTSQNVDNLQSQQIEDSQNIQLNFKRHMTNINPQENYISQFSSGSRFSNNEGASNTGQISGNNKDSSNTNLKDLLKQNIGAGNQTDHNKGRQERINSSSSFKDSIQRIVPAAISNIMGSLGIKVNTFNQGEVQQIKKRSTFVEKEKLQQIVDDKKMMGESFFYIEKDEKINKFSLANDQFKRTRKMTMDNVIIKKNMVNRIENIQQMEQKQQAQLNPNNLKIQQNLPFSSLQSEMLPLNQIELYQNVNKYKSETKDHKKLKLKIRSSFKKELQIQKQNSLITSGAASKTNQSQNLMLNQQIGNDSLAWEDFDSQTCPESPIKSYHHRQLQLSKIFKQNINIFKDQSDDEISCRDFSQKNRPDSKENLIQQNKNVVQNQHAQIKNSNQEEESSDSLERVNNSNDDSQQNENQKNSDINIFINTSESSGEFYQKRNSDYVVENISQKSQDYQNFQIFQEQKYQNKLDEILNQIKDYSIKFLGAPDTQTNSQQTFNEKSYSRENFGVLKQKSESEEESFEIQDGTNASKDDSSLSPYENINSVQNNQQLDQIILPKMIKVVSQVVTLAKPVNKK